MGDRKSRPKPSPCTCHRWLPSARGHWGAAEGLVGQAAAACLASGPSQTWSTGPPSGSSRKLGMTLGAAAGPAHSSIQPHLDPPRQLAAPRPEHKKEKPRTGKKVAVFTCPLVDNAATHRNKLSCGQKARTGAAQKGAWSHSHFTGDPRPQTPECCRGCRWTLPSLRGHQTPLAFRM